jgi:predicted AlkP superfamily pyrophosphatase or phosphodiesterase
MRVVRRGRAGLPEPGTRALRAVGTGVVCALLAAVGTRAAATGEEAQLEPAPARPALVLFVSVDQMRADYLTRFDALYTGGLRRLLDAGAVFTQARYRHADTETAPGHAVLLSGRHPSHSGIIGNQWYDALLGRDVNCVDDPVQVPLGGEGRAASPANFSGFTVGDVLKRASPGSRVVAVAGKDRAAVLMGGRRADGAYWYENAQGRFVTSSYYARTAPAWLDAFNARRLPDAYFGRSWTRLLPDTGLYERLAGPDAVAGEWDGVDNVFSHALRAQPGENAYYEYLRRTPFLDELTLEAALAAVAGHDVGRGPATDLLIVGFSATDAIGHTYGPDSQEVMDQLLRLDRTLGALFDALEARVGRGRLLVGLSSDHGSTTLTEGARARGLDARRVAPVVFADAVKQALATRFPGASDLVARMDGPSVYFDLTALARQGVPRAAAEETAGRALVATGLVDGYYTHARLIGDAPADDPAFALFRASFFETRSPHVIGRIRANVYVSSYRGGTGHGTYHDENRHVPVVFMGPGVRPGLYAGEAGPEEVAPTLAALLGLEYPLQDARRVLTEALALGHSTP